MSGRKSKKPGGAGRSPKRPDSRRGSGSRPPQRSRQGPGERGDKPRSGNERSGSERSGRSRKPIKGLGGDQVEGRHAVRELLLAGKRRVHEVLVIDDLAAADILDDIQQLCGELGVSYRPVSRRHLASEAITESHQGVVAKASPLEEADFDAMLDDARAFLLVLDGVTDPGNLGAILRTAECAGVTGVVLGRHRSVRVTAAVTKTAAGAVEHVPIAVVGGIPTAVSTLSDRGIFTVGLDEAGSESIFNLPQDDRPVALVLGAEGKGLSRLVRQRVDVLASIPMGGRLNSLNVAMASAVACFEVVRSRTR